MTRSLRIFPETIFTAAIILAGLLTLPWSQDFRIVLKLGDAGAFILPAILAILAGIAVLRGWRTGNPHHLQNALDRAARLSLHTLIIALSILTAVMVMGRGDFPAHANEQSESAFRWLGFHNPFSFLAMILFFLASISINHSEEDSVVDRIISYGLLFLAAAIQVTLWLGAWYDPFGLTPAPGTFWQTKLGLSESALTDLANFLGLFILIAKILLLMLLQRLAYNFIIRGQCCRSLLRMDILIPVAIINVLAISSYLWLVEPLTDFRKAIRILLTLIALALLACGSLAAAFIRARTTNANATEKS